MAHKIMRALSAFVIALALAGLAAVVLLYTTGLSNSALKRSIEQSDYYEGLQQQVLQSTAAALVPTGVTEVVLAGTFTEHDVQTMVQASLGKVNNSIYLLLMDDIALRLEGNVVRYVAAQGLDADEHAQEIDEVVDYVIEGYTQSTSFPLGEQIAKLQATVGRYLPFAVVGLVLVIALAAWVLLRQRRSTAVRYTSYALGGAGLLVLTVPLVLRISQFYTRISLEPQYFYTFFVTHINHVLNVFVVTGIVLLVASIAVAMIHELGRRRRHQHATHV